MNKSKCLIWLKDNEKANGYPPYFKNTTIKYLFSAFLLFIMSHSSVAQGDLIRKKNSMPWNVVIDNANKVFIENKGQYDEPPENDKLNNTPGDNNTILYAVQSNGVDVFFTSSGIIYRHTKMIKLNKKEKEEQEHKQVSSGIIKVKKEKEKKDEEVLYKLKSSFIRMNWKGVSPQLELIAEDEVTNYFNYADLKDNTHKTTLKASAFKKIIYKNIYPHIDIEYSFPENNPGIEYSIILHPGSNYKNIKMQYEGQVKIVKDDEGNVLSASPFDEITDHIPITRYQSGNKIKSSFLLQKNIVSFQLENYDTGKTIIIDPWVTALTFYLVTKAFDIDYDYSGNVYIYGGYFPYHLNKYNSSGVLQWTYTSNAFDNQYMKYGDFAVDRNTGTSYLCESACVAGSGTRLLKINTAGIQVALFPGDNRINEFWRIAYNSCIHKGVIGCGNFSGNSYQAATFDTSITSITPVNVLSASNIDQDMVMLAVDDSNCYMATSKSSLGNFGFDNIILKCLLPALSPTVYKSPDGYNFEEISSINYYFGGSTYNVANGFNGMAKSSKYLYTYDGTTLKKWNPANGTFIDSVKVGTGNFNCGGIAVDCNDNIYVGTLTAVNLYNTKLSLISSISTAGAVYDLAINQAGNIIACGNGFVASLDLYTTNPCPCSTPDFTLHTTSTSTTCTGNNGTATVNLTGGTSPFTYSWSPGGQTTQTVTGLSAGKYIVTVKDFSGTKNTDSVFVKQTGTNITLSASRISICPGDSTIITASGAATYLWSPRAGLNSTTGTTIIARPIATTTYTAIGISGLCSDTSLITIDVLNKDKGGEISAIRDTICQGTPGTLILINNSSNVIQWQSSIDGVNFTDIAGAIDTTKYKTGPLRQSTWFCTKVGMANCSAQSDTLQLYVPSALMASFIPMQINPNKLSFNSDSSSGNIRSYYWDFDDKQTSTEKDPTHTYQKDTTYYVCLTLYDGSNCSYTFCRYITVTADAIAIIPATGDWIIYPDPFANRLNIYTKRTNNRIQNIEIYDVLGRLMISKSASNSIDIILQIDVSILSKGMYYLILKTADADYIQKVIKQ